MMSEEVEQTATSVKDTASLESGSLAGNREQHQQKKSMFSPLQGNGVFIAVECW